MALVLLVPSGQMMGQGSTKWISVGSLRNWFSEFGCEIEEGRSTGANQQDGLQWPAQYVNQDCQAAKGFWIGTTNWNDGTRVLPIAVVHVGPRVTGQDEFFPLEFKLYPKFARPRIFVDGLPTFQTVEETEDPNPSLKADRVLYTKVNTAIGVTVQRYVYAFSEQYHDNYHIYEFIFTNTGDADGDTTTIEFPNQTLSGVYFFWQYRYSACAEIRYCVNNSAGWGINTMNDARGYPPDLANSLIPASENDVRAQFAWHGYHNQANKPTAGTYPNAATYDNIGAPIWNPSASATYNIDPADTNWRLGAPQFMGTVSIYADQSPTNKVNDLTQPSTTDYVASDEPITQNNSLFNSAKMQLEYARMSLGHAPRHAWLVQGDGAFDQQTVMANIGDGAPGGWSTATGYGPYTLGPGQSVKIVYAEGVNGLSREECISVGLKYKLGTIDTKTKNDSVLLGRDRLLETFRRAEANYNSGFNIPEAPYPPTEFDVNSGGNKIALSWTPSPNETANNFVGYRVYRAESKYDSTYHLLYQCGGPAPTDPKAIYSPSVNYAYDDTSAIRGRDYYYHIVSFSSPLPADPTTHTPGGVLESSTFYTQTYDPANLKRPAGTSPDAIRIVPNPYIASGTYGVSVFSSERPDRIAFFDIPGDCSIKIYTELGELIYEIDHTNGTGDDYWNSVTSSNQVVASGIYLVVITARADQNDPVTGEVQFKAGQTIIKKLVIIR